MNIRKTKYLAYGSNLNLAQMAQRCPTARVIGSSELVNHRLLFRGSHEGAVATVEPHEGSRVPVLVWELTPADEAALDRYEGFPFLYRKETIRAKLDGKNIRAMVYIMNVEMPAGCYRPLGRPSAHYYAAIMKGYVDAGFDTEILHKATTDSFEPEDSAAAE